MECTHSERRWLPYRLSTYPQESGNITLQSQGSQKHVCQVVISPKRKARQSFSQVDKITLLVLLSSYNHPLTKLWYRDLSVSSRLLHARLSHRHGHVSVVVAYAPTEGSPDLDKDQFYYQLSSVVQSISSHDELILLGDFNAVTEPRAQGSEDVVGNFVFFGHQMITAHVYL